MLSDMPVAATVAVKDLARARRFYEETLGLKDTGDGDPEVITFRSGNTRINVYHSQFAGTNQATAATWVVGDKLDEIVRGLKAKGVVFEHYDIPDLTRDGDVYVNGAMKVAWFKDPDGNILNLINV
jgi:catechol 2,3-dioxygenase-like lactoylglutathione lyase family enzyme